MWNIDRQYEYHWKYVKYCTAIWISLKICEILYGSMNIIDQIVCEILYGNMNIIECMWKIVRQYAFYWMYVNIVRQYEYHWKYVKILKIIETKYINLNMIVIAHHLKKENKLTSSSELFSQHTCQAVIVQLEIMRSRIRTLACLVLSDDWHKSLWLIICVPPMDSKCNSV